MPHRIRKATVLSTADGSERGAFVFDEDEEHYDVLLANEEEFTILKFKRATMVEIQGGHLLHIPTETA